MANTKSAAKQARAAVRRRTRNRVQISTVRTSEKKIRALAKAGKTDEAAKLSPSFTRRLTAPPRRAWFIGTPPRATKSASPLSLRQPSSRRCKAADATTLFPRSRHLGNEEKLYSAAL